MFSSHDIDCIKHHTEHADFLQSPLWKWS